MVTAIVLAAGLSKRMGNNNKMLLPYKGKTVIAATVENIVASGIRDIVVVVVGFEREKLKEALEGLPVKLIDNPDYEKGMTTSIQKGVACSATDGYMICLGDMIHITAAEYALLAANFEQAYTSNKACIIVPFYKGEKGNPVIFSHSYREAILQHADMEGCKSIVHANKENIVAVEMYMGNVVADLDYPSDYTKLSEA